MDFNQSGSSRYIVCDFVCFVWLSEARPVVASLLLAKVSETITGVGISVALVPPFVMVGVAIGNADMLLLAKSAFIVLTERSWNNAMANLPF